MRKRSPGFFVGFSALLLVMLAVLELNKNMIAGWLLCLAAACVYVLLCGRTERRALRALLISNLITLHAKTGIGRLSAYCGAVSAGAGAASGVAYLQGGRFEVIAHTIVNTVAVTSGIVCDGAKASCAAKIAAAVDAGLLGLAMYRSGNEFFGGDGIVKKGVERTIEIVGKLASRGMVETDKEIIRLMMEK